MTFTASVEVLLPINSQLLLLLPQRHHFAQTIAILNTVGCNIFEKFSRKVMRGWR